MYITLEMLKEAWISLSSYKLRSFLTILGIIIGVAAVVVMVSVGEGVRNQINEQFEGLGSNLMMINPGSHKSHGISSGKVQTLTYEDANAIANLSSVDNASYTNSTSAQAIYGKNNWDTSVYGTTSSYFKAMNLKIDKGRIFTDKDNKFAYSYAVIGSNVKEELFPDESAVGKTIKLNNVPFKVIGLLKEKGSSFGPSQDDMVMIPFRTFLMRISGSKYPKSVDRIVINVKDKQYQEYTETKVTKLLRQRHKLKDDAEDDFRIMNLEELNDTMKETAEMFSILLASIASISLLVGSIGIMNMMLVSVSERTKEIGLRKAVGAKEKIIMQQFLFEAILISFIGSMIGLGIGLGLSQFSTRFISIEMPVSVFAIVMSFIVSIIVGVSSGLFPAIKAAKLNPIDALRYE